MAGFKQLADASRAFQSSLKVEENELDVVVDILVPPDEAIRRKLQCLDLLKCKQTLVSASISEVSVHDELRNCLTADYDVTEAAKNTIEDKLIEEAFIKSVVTSNEVKDLLLTPERSLTLDQRDSKSELISLMNEQTLLEDQLLLLDERQREKEEQLQKLRSEWYQTLCQLKERQAHSTARRENIGMTAEREKLKTLVERMELMRMLISRLATSKTYDWYKDPQKLISLLPLTRQPNTLDQFTD